LTPPAWLGNSGALFIAHSRALPAGWSPALAASEQRIWTSGTRSWLRLAARGIWVEGCAEETGFAAVTPTLTQKVLQLPALPDWRVLTHADGTANWPSPHVIATYAAELRDELHARHPAVEALRAARSAFWTSGSQFAAFRPWIPANIDHACRYGKTYNYLREQLGMQSGARLTAYPNVTQWRARTK
jgi:hypothetical protein